MSELKARITFVNGQVINILLRPDVAPISVKNFTELANGKFYDGLCFHRVIPEFMIQGGGMATDGKALAQKKAPREIYGEFKINGWNNTLSHKPGVVSMARTQVLNSATSQFFICVADCSFLDGQYAAFGECADEDSLATAIAVSRVPTHSVSYYDDVPISPVIIESIRVFEED